MGSHEKFYRNFERPPFAPVFYPTAEEFSDPIAYVAKIRPDAEKYGVIKIVPPAEFKPPFAIDLKKFEFTPRIQRINEIEAIVRESQIFNDRLVHYWQLQGVTIVIPFIDQKYVDVFMLSKLVDSHGGSNNVTQKKLWSQVAKKLGFNKNSNHTPTKIKDYYLKHILPFVKNLEQRVVPQDVEIDDEEEEEKEGSDKQCKATMQGRRRAARPAGRMMAGLAQPKSRMNQGRMSSSSSSSQVHISKKPSDPMENVYCTVCARGDDEENLLLCEDCDRSIHTRCCDPPLKQVPTGEWRCPQCVANEVAKIGSNFGFPTADVKYNMHTFHKFADDFKKDFFAVDDPRDVPAENVEKQFWRHVNDMDNTVSVKYGADLITSEVGSGFPRKCDEHHGPDAKKRITYANHAWNLNNLPVLKESVLSHIDRGISGMMVPWVYVGMCFSTFCWHTEDHWTYSINYNHIGERKIWYGVGGHDAEKFENTVRDLAPDLTSHQKDIFHQMTTAVNPALLRSKGLDVYTVHQNEGEFVITFPRAYHAGFNEGFNFAEAVNFAPIDWLRMGRLCVSEYAKVRRPCVFSHDELVLKMVHSCNKLGIQMSLAALEELVAMTLREKANRDLVQKSGVKKTLRVKFEEIPDDNAARVCRYCNTTIFLSALTCPHNKTVCLDHIDHLCSKCSPAQRVLKYSYNMVDIEPLIKNLKERTIFYFQWVEQGEAVLNDPKGKPLLSSVESLIETARQKHFPNADPLHNLIVAARSCHSTMEKARNILNAKIRTRACTRAQRPDFRPDLAHVNEIINELKQLPCQVGEILEKMQELLEMIAKWRLDAVKTIANATDFASSSTDDGPTTSTGSISQEEIMDVIQRGKEFDVQTPEMDALIKAVETREWMMRAVKILDWEATDDMESDEDYAERTRWDLNAILKLIKDGSEIMRDSDPNRCVERLHARYKSAVTSDNGADKLKEDKKATLKQLEDLWKVARQSDWCKGTGMDWMRKEIVEARQLKKNSADQSEIVTLRDVTLDVERIQKSAILTSTSYYKERVALRVKLEKFTEQISMLFQRSHSYYDLVEIVRDREDLAALIEGQTVSRQLHSVNHLYEEWALLVEFDCSKEMMTHLSKLRDQQKKLMSALQMANTQRTVRDTCVCAMTKDAGKDGGIVVCLVCRAKYHGVCCEWDPFLNRLPEGAFLCLRCLRGRRPCVEDVQAACNQAPTNSLEVMLVRQLLERARDYSRSAMDILGDVAIAGANWDTELTNRARWVVESVLSCELLDLDIFNKVIGLLPRICGDIMHNQTLTLKTIRDRPVRAKPVQLLFVAPSRTKKRHVSVPHNGRRDRKRARPVTVYHEDDQPCSALLCLKPYGEQVGWVQCEAGCDRWYHYICVGQTVEVANSSEEYACNRCSLGPAERALADNPASQAVHA